MEVIFIDLKIHFLINIILECPWSFDNVTGYCYGCQRGIVMRDCYLWKCIFSTFKIWGPEAKTYAGLKKKCRIVCYKLQVSCDYTEIFIVGNLKIMIYLDSIYFCKISGKRLFSHKMCKYIFRYFRQIKFGFCVCPLEYEALK